MKYRLIWFSEAASHYLTVYLLRWLNKKGYGASIFLCGPPRCGTSWISDILAFYYNLPRPKHYKLPLWFDAVVHTHEILEGQYVPQAFYATRYGLDAYLSRYFQIRRDMVNGVHFVGEKRYLRMFKDVALDENTSYNVKSLLDQDLKKGKGLIFSLATIERLKRQNNAVVIDYDRAQIEPLEVFSDAINSYSGAVDKTRLERVLQLLSKDEQRKLSADRRSTHINSKASKSDEMLTPELIAYYEAELERLVNKVN